MKEYGKLILAVVGIAVAGNTISTALKYKFLKDAMKYEVQMTNATK